MSGLTGGEAKYVSSHTIAEHEAAIGNAKTSDALIAALGLTQDEIDALTGAASASGTNVLVTTDDIDGFASPDDLAAINAKLPTTDQKAALAGTSGTPSASNPYATQAALACKADLVDGAVPVEQLPDSALLGLGELESTAYRGDRGKTAYDHSQEVMVDDPHGANTALAAEAAAREASQATQLPRVLRVGTFGDSTANICGSSGIGKTDMENLAETIPISGTTTAAIQGTLGTLSGRLPFEYVANGGWSGQTTTQFLARSTNAASATRRALPDVMARNIDILEMNGGSINDISSVTSYNEATLDLVVDRHRQCVEFFTRAGIPVIDMGIYGYSATSTYADIIRQSLLYINARIAALASNDELWLYIEPSGVSHDGTGAWKTNYSSDGVHPSELGAYYIGTAKAEKIGLYFKSGHPSEVLYDSQSDYAQASSSIPANLAVTTSGVTNITYSCDGSTWEITGTFASTSSYVIISIPNASLPAVLANAVVGETYIMQYSLGVCDSNGDPVTTLGNLLFYWYYTDNTAKLLYGHTGLLYAEQANNYVQFGLPEEITSMGTSSFIRWYIYGPDAGTYTIKMHPYRIWNA